jgi:hypothetical protein
VTSLTKVNLFTQAGIGEESTGSVEIRVSVGISGEIVGENDGVGSGMLFPAHADNRRHRQT